LFTAITSTGEVVLSRARKRRTTKAAEAAAATQAASEVAALPRGPATTRAGNLVLAGLLGAAFFLFRFGARIVAPGHVSWLLARDDMATHYIGWLFFSSEGWLSPPGRIGGYLAPAGTSVAMTDSLPLLAVPLKVLAFLLPQPFQFAGFYMLLTYALQAVFAYLLVSALCRTPALRWLAVGLFLLSPTFLLREGHISLSSHWVILAGLWLYFREREVYRLRRVAAGWLLLLAACAGIHPYLTAMVLGLAAASFLRDFLGEKRMRWYQLVGVLAAMPAVIMAVWYVSGYLLVGPAGAQYARSALNLNAAWNPLDTSLVLKELPTNAAFKQEGYQYFGLGLFAALLLGLLLRWHRPTSRHRLQRHWLKRHWPLLLVLLGTTLFALGNQIAYNTKILVSYRVPDLLLPLFSPFRACARFFWPTFYSIIAGVIVLLAPHGRKKLVVVLFAGCVVLQAVDIWRILNIRTQYADLHFASSLRSGLWQDVLSHVDHIATYPPYQKDTDAPMDFRGIALLAAEHGKTTSAGYVARLSQSDLAAYGAELRQQMFERPDPRAVYILRHYNFINWFSSFSKVLDCTDIDGMKVCFAPASGIRVPAVYRLKSYQLEDYLARVMDNTVVIVVKGEATQNLGDSVKQQLAERGSDIGQLQEGGSYAAIIHKGEMMFEQVKNDQPILAVAERGMQAGSLLFKKELIFRSGGLRGGNLASVLVDGKEQLFNLNGMNLLVLDEDQNVLEVACFDTHSTQTGSALVLVPPSR
jgi:hypothetical protein